MQPNIQLKQIKEICKSEYKVHVGISLCMRIKQKVMEVLLGDYKLQYGVLHDYVEEVLSTNQHVWFKQATKMVKMNISDFMFV